MSCWCPGRSPISYGKRTLTEEENHLWRSVAQGATPLRGDKCFVPKAPPVRVSVRPSFPPERAQYVPSAPQSALHLGAYAGVDRNTADTFRKGRYPLDASLDLHGMSREQAHMATCQFVHAHYAMGARCLLIITGKGNVLRELLPAWLNEPGLRPFVLALDHAKQHHGGGGAYYLLLRRKR